MLDETLVFDSRDSGQNGYNVVWSAYEDEKVTISGGTTLSEWTKVDEEKNIWKAPAKGIESRELYVNGKRAILARERAEALDDTSINKEVYIKRDNLPESFAKVEDLEVVFGRKWKWAILRVSGIKTLTDDALPVVGIHSRFHSSSGFVIALAWNVCSPSGRFGLRKVEYLKFNP